MDNLLFLGIKPSKLQCFRYTVHSEKIAIGKIFNKPVVFHLEWKAVAKSLKPVDL